MYKNEVKCFVTCGSPLMKINYVIVGVSIPYLFCKYLASNRLCEFYLNSTEIMPGNCQVKFISHFIELKDSYDH